MCNIQFYYRSFEKVSFHFLFLPMQMMMGSQASLMMEKRNCLIQLKSQQRSMMQMMKNTEIEVLKLPVVFSISSKISPGRRPLCLFCSSSGQCCFWSGCYAIPASITERKESKRRRNPDIENLKDIVVG